jgi:two-component system, chemotaxis family, sensor kinase CheA
MSIELGQFHHVYYEESAELLQTMESGMLNLDDKDLEQINTIFRAAHSLKGGSATFGFIEIAGFTHNLETLLDEMRKGKRSVTPETKDLLLQSVDCLQDMIHAAHDRTSYDREKVLLLQKEFERINGASAPSNFAPKETANEIPVAAAGWRIDFRPLPHLFRTGNDPVRLFRALQELGELTVNTDVSAVPPFLDMDPENCGLSWDLALQTRATKNQIIEIFEWVEGDCELEIAPLQFEPPAISAAGSITALQSESSGSNPAERRSGNDRRSGADRRHEASSIRVNTEKIDALINLVGELVITQAMLSQTGENFDLKNLDKLRDGLNQLERNTHELQESIMRIRMLPISFAFSRLPRLVHDLSQKLGKEVDLQISGDQTELDKTVMEKIGDPLLHIIRNSVDHGIELPEARIAAGKPRVGVIRLGAYHREGNIFIEVTDDGAGINRSRLLQKARESGATALDEELTDEKILEFIFLPGLSTADTVSDISGRGVGMDVVRRNIRELQGHIEVSSQEGQGTTIQIRLPLTLAILDGQLVRIGKEKFIIPLISIAESLQMELNQVSTISGRTEIFTLRGEHIPIVRLTELFGFRPEGDSAESLLVVVEGEGQRVGLAVNELLSQQQVVIKSLETNFKKVEGISGATILGDGSVALIVDIAGLIALSRSAARPSATVH